MPPSSVAFFIPRPAIQPQQALEELAVLVEIIDGRVVVGAWALHELMEVSRSVLLGLHAQVIGRCDRCGFSRSAAIL